MISAKPEPSTGGLSYEGRLPLTWKEIDPPQEGELRDLKFSNMEVLRTLFSLEMHAGEVSDELSETVSQHVARLDCKLNLLLDMVGYLLSQQQLIPDPHPLNLTADTIRWQDKIAPLQDSLLRIELFCSTHYPRPLALHARVIERASLPEGWLITAAFEGLGETMRDGLERFIFIQHRRAISHIRRNRRVLL